MKYCQLCHEIICEKHAVTHQHLKELRNMEANCRLCLEVADV